MRIDYFAYKNENEVLWGSDVCFRNEYDVSDSKYEWIIADIYERLTRDFDTVYHHTVEE